MNKAIFKDKDLIIVAAHHFPDAVALAVNNLLEIIKPRNNTLLVILDSAAHQEVKDYLKTIRHERVLIEHLEKNVGKAGAANNFIARNIDPANLPRTVWSVDPDVLFDPLSFDYLLEAVQNIDRIGMLGMRYKKNKCNPEIYLFFPPKNIFGKNGKTYSVIFPFMANVAGPIFVIPGELLAHPLNFRLFPVKEEKSYCMDDAATHDALRKYGFRNGYLNGTLVNHLRSGKFLADELVEYSKRERNG